LHVLSSFQRTGRSLLPIGLLTLRSPPRLSPSGEPSNLTRSFRLVSTPSPLSRSFFFWRADIAPEEARRRRTAGVEPEGLTSRKKIARVLTLATVRPTLAGSRSVHSIYAAHRTVSTSTLPHRRSSARCARPPNIGTPRRGVNLGGTMSVNRLNVVGPTCLEQRGAVMNRLRPAAP
jgi:hypothetical protein